MKITRLQLYETSLFDSLFPYLDGRVFHVTKESYLLSIIDCGEIRPNPDGSYETSFGSSKTSFFRNRGCVSLFDYRSATAEQFEKFSERCLPTQPASPESGIAILFVSESVYPVLLPWTLCKEEQAHGEMIVPYLEAGHAGPLSLKNINEVIILAVISEMAAEVDGQIKDADARLSDINNRMEKSERS